MLNRGEFETVGDFGTVIVHSGLGMSEENDRAPASNRNEFSAGPGNVADPTMHDLRHRSTDNWSVSVLYHSSSFCI